MSSHLESIRTLASISRKYDSRPPRVLHLIGSLGRGGAEEVVVNLCQNMSGEFTSAICSLSDFTPLASRIGPEVELLTLGMHERLSLRNQYFVFRKARAEIRRFAPDIIHSHLFGLTSLHALSCLHSTKAKHFVTIHSAGLHYDVSDRSRRSVFLRFVERLTYRLLRTNVVAVSQPVASTAASFLGVPIESIAVVRNGIDTKRRFNPDNYPTRESREFPRAVYVARMDSKKGHRTLLMAWKFIILNFPDAKLLLVGDGGCRPDLEQFASSLGIGASVFFLGPRDDVPEILAECDIGLFPSEYEGLPLAALEMMSMGLPVIGSNIPPLVEILEPPTAGFVAPVGDFDQFALEVKRILGAPLLLRAMASRARDRAASQFSVESMARQYMDLYRSALT